ncbi:TetR/AcrR family transcriptional regulator [Teredinibacter haidensis]|uniref:TetR/AcrR family transcriptional regulator n=1 Tax=Teredinibacter haidensis TaxID=2731755 RepID=UPI000948F158|nr:TetR/AcrR family transcriptional regulator [Teredinibacter haidensis]
MNKPCIVKRILTRSEQKRAAIVNAAMLEFQTRGFQASNMDDIALRAEVSKRTVYNHFPSKDALFGAIMEKMVEMLRDFEHVPFSAETPLEQQLRQLVSNEISLLQAEGFISLARMIFAETIHSPNLIQTALQTFNKQESPIANWFNAAVKAGALKAEHPDILVTQFTAVIKSFCFWPQLIEGAAFPDKEKIALVSDTVVQMMLKQYS